ncbi:DMT family transporter [Nocardia testacea]|uniref:DMT family transporter n=1 Tax=Nocardia testacea TaxID=248551 RepID=UPI0009FEE8E2|nr:DMT family transporter [Nocardia testacea]
MREHSSATPQHQGPLSSVPLGPAWGLLGVAAFSLTVPLTRITVAEGGMSPLFVACGRAVVAGVLAATALLVTRPPLPRGRQWIRLGVVAAGVVAGFPLLTSFALTLTSAGHSAVVIALLPAATAVLAVLRTEERPPRAFWWAAAAGAVAAVGFAVFRGGGFGLQWPDLLLFGAVVAAAAAYAEGGLLARELGPWQTISWALVLSAPPMVALSGIALAFQPPTASPAQWASFAYLGVVSMFLGFLAWYRGLAYGPMAQVSQIQLVQPVLTLGWAALLLGESLTWSTALGALAVITCAAGAVRTRLGRPAPDAGLPPGAAATRRDSAPRAERTAESATGPGAAEQRSAPARARAVR